MSSPADNLTAPPGDARVPWTARDAWLGLGLAAVMTVGFLIALVSLPGEWVNGSALVLAELIYLIPVLVFLAIRGAGLKSLGFVKFEGRALGLGCGLLLAAYAVILIHNSLLFVLGIRTQGEMINKLAQDVQAGWLILSASVLAPLVEEVFFRGFVFAGFRRKYGWVRALLASSALFAAAHLDPASLIPTFVLGCVLAYVYNRSNSIWPGIILHFLVNTSSLCATFALLRFSATIP